jgi:hypothetical protein
VECTEKTGFLDFGFFRQGNKPALRGRRRLLEEKCKSQDQRMAVWYILNGIGRSKTEIPVESRRADPIRAGASPSVAANASGVCILQVVIEYEYQSVQKFEIRHIELSTAE